MLRLRVGFQVLYTISNLCASISNFVFFDIGVSLSDPAWAAVAPTSSRYWSQIAVCTLHCDSIIMIARGSCAALAALRLSRSSGGCTRRRRAAAAPAASCRTLRSLSGAPSRPPAWSGGCTAAAAGAGIDGTQERVIQVLRDQN